MLKDTIFMSLKVFFNLFKKLAVSLNYKTFNIVNKVDFVAIQFENGGDFKNFKVNILRGCARVIVIKKKFPWGF